MCCKRILEYLVVNILITIFLFSPILTCLCIITPIILLCVFKCHWYLLFLEFVLCMGFGYFLIIERRSMVGSTSTYMSLETFRTLFPFGISQNWRSRSESKLYFCLSSTRSILLECIWKLCHRCHKFFSPISQYSSAFDAFKTAISVSVYTRFVSRFG